MTSLLEQFRAQYPEGCLSADLVSIHDGQYIVRAVASSQGAPLATGLAASADVQVAEDRARERAIALLGFRSAQTDSQIASKNAPQSVAQTASQNAPQSDSSPAEVVSSSATDKSEPEQADVTLAPPEAEPDPADDSGPPLDAISEEPVEEPVEERADSRQQPSAATIALENFNTSPNPVNLSDVIAQTDVELMRLGWTNAQGREYLEKTYGKRSRQQLTDEELMSFLLYLEEQS